MLAVRKRPALKGLLFSLTFHVILLLAYTFFFSPTQQPLVPVISVVPEHIPVEIAESLPPLRSTKRTPSRTVTKKAIPSPPRGSKSVRIKKTTRSERETIQKNASKKAPKAHTGKTKKKATEAKRQKERALARKRAQEAVKARQLAAAKELAKQQQLVDLIQQQMMACWNITTETVRNAYEVIVTITLKLAEDGSILSLKTLREKSTTRHKHFRAVEQSVKQSFARPACRKLDLPPALYYMWKETNVRFSPQNVL